MLSLSCDYNWGCTPEILQALTEANARQFTPYGQDELSQRAKDKIRAAIGNPEADIYFLIGGTQTNSVALAAMLAPYEGVLCAGTGHITDHEAGAIECTGHKVLPVVGDEQGKISLDALQEWLVRFFADGFHDHIVHPGAVYISQPTELGGVYTKAELRALRRICDRYGLRLYVDGARLAYALGSRDNDVTLETLGSLTDAFYIGGTKCGALFGEALVFKKTMPHFFTLHKQHGALLAKGWLTGLQFDVLFTDGLYQRLGAHADRLAELLRDGLQALQIPLLPPSPSNQQFALLTDEQVEKLAGRFGYDLWGRQGAYTQVRFCPSWANTEEQILALLDALS
mgnify:CR=1 FL=1